jgi:hypothetical protein
VAEGRGAHAMSSPVGEPPPHWLDRHFRHGGEADVTLGLVTDPVFIRAVREAVEVRRHAEEERRKDPTARIVSPTRQARQAFLNVLNDPNATA